MREKSQCIIQPGSKITTILYNYITIIYINLFQHTAYPGLTTARDHWEDLDHTDHYQQSNVSAF